MPCFIYDMYPAEERSENENGIVPGKKRCRSQSVFPRPIMRGCVERFFKKVKRGHLPISLHNFLSGATDPEKKTLYFLRFPG
ncbi:hypothetical protein AR443_11300 [Bacillus velezensis]|nr:hypothetical protein OY17_04970 [Bacillus sp. BH072]KFI14548.1 hypothetical protein IO97_16910 [Bacillus velezensis]CCG48420.1 hypothetical protein BANAU_0398 [Bacillus velezensis YAU B9601-Y2]KOC79243.1 hypothetical protein AKJ10_17960 [Bacillus velezensis]KSV97705.1 hypothetical protein AR443_11300 [Bacillus velezensis]